MNKPADTDLPILDLIRDRWSPRSFADRAVSREAVHTLFEAARWAPSAFNEQPWRFIVATRGDTDAFVRLASVIVPGNRAWSDAAPVLAVGLAKETFTLNGKPNRHALYDLGQSVAVLTVQAQALPPELAARERAPRSRKSRSDFVFGGAFGETW